MMPRPVTSIIQTTHFEMVSNGRILSVGTLSAERYRLSPPLSEPYAVRPLAHRYVRKQQIRQAIFLTSDVRSCGLHHEPCNGLSCRFLPPRLLPNSDWS